MGPYLSAMSPSVRCSSLSAPRRWRWPIRGHRPDGSGGLLPFFLFPLALTTVANNRQIVAIRSPKTVISWGRRENPMTRLYQSEEKEGRREKNGFLYILFSQFSLFRTEIFIHTRSHFLWVLLRCKKIYKTGLHREKIYIKGDYIEKIDRSNSCSTHLPS